MPSSRLTDSEIAVVCGEQDRESNAYRGNTPWCIEFAHRVEKLVAERLSEPHCEGCHVPNICRGFLRDDEKGGERA